MERVRAQVHDLAELKGHPEVVLTRLARDYESSCSESVASLRTLVRTLSDYGVSLDRVELDLGFGRGIGFYTQMIFEILVPTPEGKVEVCGGGRYDGLARVLGSDRDDRGVGFAFGLERLGAGARRPGACFFDARANRVPGHRLRSDRPPPQRSSLRPGSALSAPVRSWRPTENSGSTRRPRWPHRMAMAAVVVVTGSLDEPNGLTVHDLANSTRTASSVSDLVRLARAEAEGRRR